MTEEGMAEELDKFLAEHTRLSRRFLLRCGAAGAAALSSWPLVAAGPSRAAALRKAIGELETYFTAPDDFQDVSRGKPRPYSLALEKKKEVGLTRDTWSMDVLGDPEHPAVLRNPLSREGGNALDFKGLMRLAKEKAVRFPKIMTCLNIGCPLGTGIWEGVPLREVLWLTRPVENLRRVFYHGYHNDDPKQMFRSSLPVDRILEDPPGLPPIILCYKLNDEWLTPKRGGPVRIIVPEGYGFKSVKWITKIFLSNLYHANDTYANGNNDVASSLKTFADAFAVPSELKPGQPFAVTGYAQVGVSGLSRVQAWVQDDTEELPADDPFHTKAPWRDAEILPPPAPGKWGGNLPRGEVPANTMGFDLGTRRPEQWPVLLGKAHWAILMPGLPEGSYTFRCRTIDANGHAQPMPRPFKKSGRASISQIDITVAS